MKPSFKSPRPLRLPAAARISCFLLYLLLVWNLVAQEEPLVKPMRSKRLLGTGERPQERTVAPEGEGILPYSEIIRDVEPPYEDIFQPIRAGGSESVKLGSGGAAKFHANFLRGLGFNTPFRKGIRPEDAELKLGNFYVDITALSGSILYSDNIHLEENNTDDGVIAVTRMNLQGVFQLGENFRIAVRGALIYFPLKNEIGIAGFGIEDPLAHFEYFPLTEAQFAYNLMVGRWEVQLYDNFGVTIERFGSGLSYDLFDGATFDEADEAGRYRFRSNVSGLSGGGDPRDRDLRVGSDLLGAHNTVGVTASRLVPTETRVEIGAYHQDSWYYGPVDKHTLPKTQEAGFINLINEREEMRFKPFAMYKVSRYNYESDWDHKFRSGVRGPITDYIYFLGDVGFFYSGQSDRSGLLWRLRFDHEPTPLILQRFEYSRDVTDPDHDLEERLSYRFRYRINEDLSAEAFAIRSHFEDLDLTNTESDETRFGLRFTYRLAQRTTMRVGAVYNQVDYVNPALADAKVWTARLEFLYRYSQTLEARLTYQYQTRDSDRIGDSYDENVVILSVIKYL